MANRLVINQTIAAYANTLIDAVYAAGGRDAVVEVRNQLLQIKEAMATNIDLRTALNDEGYSAKQREEIAENVFAGFNPLLVEFLGVMASRQDVDKLRRVYLDYEELIETKLNFSVVDVKTVVELDDHLRTVITEKAESDLGRDVVLVEHIDPSIKGGIVMGTRGRFVDASVSRQLSNARLVLKQTDGGER